MTNIGTSAFKGCSSLISVDINNVTNIGTSAFKGCSNLVEMTIPNSVVEIGGNVFEGCSLKKLTILDGESELVLQSSSFRSCPIEHLYLGRNINHGIMYSPFTNNTYLTSLVIGNSVTAISDYAFQGCSGLTEVTIPQNVTNIGYSAFGECFGLKNLTILDGESDLALGLFPFNSCPVEQLYLGRNISSGWFSFNKTSLNSLIIGNYVTSIKNEAFSNCSNLIELIIGNSMETIGDKAFRSCSSLISLTIPDCVTSIGTEAFYGCSSLVEVTIPGSVTTMNSKTFADCSNLKVVTISDSKNILSFPFSSQNTPFVNCPIEKLYLGRNISYYTTPFQGKTSLIALIIGDNVTNINNSTFEGCSGLKELTIADSEDELTLESLSFNNCAIEQLYLGRNINTPLFQGKASLTSLIVGDKVTKICNYAFQFCSGLTELVIPNSMISIGDWAFYGCSGLAGVVIPNSVTSIGNSAFSGCALTDVTIPNSVLSIGSYAFNYCGKLTKVTISDGTGELMLESSPFNECPIEELYLGRSIIYNSSYSPFRDKTSLTSLVIGNSVVSIGDWAFSGCSSLKEVNIPNSVVSIGDYAFINCSDITSLTIPSSVTSIGDYAFQSCSSIGFITTFNTTPPMITLSTFSITTEQNAILYVPEGYKTVYEQADGWRNFLDIQDGTVTGITSVDINKEDKQKLIYTVDGKKLNATDISCLPDGVYIINRKKYQVSRNNRP